jgi:hypothetical protein
VDPGRDRLDQELAPYLDDASTRLGEAYRFVR